MICRVGAQHCTCNHHSLPKENGHAQAWWGATLETQLELRVPEGHSCGASISITDGGIMMVGYRVPHHGFQEEDTIRGSRMLDEPQ
jgi:hypothetical protein